MYTNFNLVIGNSFGSKILFFNGKTVNHYTMHDLTAAENVVTDTGFDLNRTTIIYIHGWNQSFSSKSSRAIVNAYITNGQYNILVLDWSTASSGIFPLVESRVDECSRII
ncbi:hypothetical protein Bhyg_14768 [Pseudolycoriella hygida]|uniref:Lipase domain-containing protein n=1 Tax=Pseudolycoriella hygida TaxID=35572 RepID=A0A9Q0MSA0_9DIPT|nr:hypothetical protein Bhyg_14768 [Pseudolycoriella hygida]